MDPVHWILEAPVRALLPSSGRHRRSTDAARVPADRRVEVLTVHLTARTSGPALPRGEDSVAWTVTHLKASPDHLDYREHITRPYRFEPELWR